MPARGDDYRERFPELATLTAESVELYGPDPIFETEEVNVYAGSNARCKDRVEFHLIWDHQIDEILELGHRGKKCCLTSTMCDVLCWNLIGKPLDAILDMDIKKLVQCPITPARMECVELPIEILRQIHSGVRKPRMGASP